VGATTPTIPVAPVEPPAHDDSRSLAAARAALAIAFGPVEARGFAVRLWDGSVDEPAGSASPFTLVVRRPGALRRALLPPSELALVEAYLRDDLDLEGDLVSFRVEGADGFGVPNGVGGRERGRR